MSDKTNKTWHAHIITGAPDFFPGFLSESLAGKAHEKGVWDYSLYNLYEFGEGAHNKIDAPPYGGGAGLVLRADIAGAALEHVLARTKDSQPDLPILMASARGAPFTQARAQELAQAAGAIFLCSRFEGVDARLTEHYPIEELSLGDYILSGGEQATLIMMDAILRLRPRVMGSAASLAEESFSNGLLEYPHYTKPAEWRGLGVPDVLRQGDHARIAQFRLSEAEKRTRARRPDLWALYRAKNPAKKGK